MTYQPEWVDPHKFAEKMKWHWKENLGNEVNDRLIATWRWMGHYFRVHITEHDIRGRRYADSTTYVICIIFCYDIIYQRNNETGNAKSTTSIISLIIKDNVIG